MSLIGFAVWKRTRKKKLVQPYAANILIFKLAEANSELCAGSGTGADLYHHRWRSYPGGYDHTQQAARRLPPQVSAGALMISLQTVF